MLHNPKCSWICWHLCILVESTTIFSSSPARCVPCGWWRMEMSAKECVIGVEVAVTLHHAWHRQLGAVGLWSPWSLLLWARWSWTSCWVRQIRNKTLSGNILAVIAPSVLWDNTDINSMIQTRSHGSQALNSFGILSPHELLQVTEEVFEAEYKQTVACQILG